MKRSAFTLLELMIVVAIVGFLASIALPKYTAFFDRARQAEVALNLAGLHAAQQAYFLRTGKYSSVLAGNDSVGWQPAGYNGGGDNARFSYTYGFKVPGAREGVHYFTGKLGVPVSSLGKCHANKDGFVARAGMKVSRTKRDDIWSIDQDRDVVHVVDGV